MTRFRAVNLDCNFDYSYERARLEACGIELVLRKCVTEDEIIAAARDVDAVIVEGAKTPVTARVIENLTACRIITKYAVGVDNIDLTAASRSGMVVANAADYCTEEVSDQAGALILASMRQVTQMDRFVRAGNWSGYAKPFPLRRMNRLTLGLIGWGRIAQATARKMAGFQMKILATDPYLTESAGHPQIQFTDLETLLKQADIVSVHVPLTAETRGMLNVERFRMMKRNAIVVNTSRGPVIQESALIQALQEKWIAGAALDVVEEEPLPTSSPLRSLSNVILTPHCAADSVDSLAHVRKTAIDSVIAVLTGFWPPFPVNPKVTPVSRLEPWSRCLLSTT